MTEIVLDEQSSLISTSLVKNVPNANGSSSTMVTNFCSESTDGGKGIYCFQHKKMTAIRSEPKLQAVYSVLYIVEQKLVRISIN